MEVLLFNGLDVVIIHHQIAVGDIRRIVELYEKCDTIPLATDKTERIPTDANAEIVVANDVIFFAESVWRRDVCVHFTSAILSPHYSGAETIGPIGLLSAIAAIDEGTSSQPRHLPAFDVIEAAIKGHFICHHHTLERTPITGVPQRIELCATYVGGEAPLWVGDF